MRVMYLNEWNNITALEVEELSLRNGYAYVGSHQSTTVLPADARKKFKDLMYRCIVLGFVDISDIGVKFKG